MADINRVSATLTADDIKEINNALQSLRSKLPFLLTLSQQERRELAKMGEKSVGFDEKCEAYMTTHPQFLPGFVPAEEVTKDRALRSQILQFSAEAIHLCQAMEHTKMLLGSEIWIADLAYYQSVRNAAHQGLPGAEAIYQDLRSRFPRGHSVNDTDADRPATPGAEAASA